MRVLKYHDRPTGISCNLSDQYGEKKKKNSDHTQPHLGGLKWMFMAPEELRADFQHLNMGYRKHGQASASGSLGMD